MSSPRHWLGRLARGFLYVGALCVGAGLAQITSGAQRDEPDQARKPLSPARDIRTQSQVLASALTAPLRERPSAPVAATVTVTATAIDATEPEPEPAPPAEAPAPVEIDPLAPDNVASALGGAFKRGRIITGSTPHRLILFTFDDGPDPRTTPLLLDRLDDAGIKAVFFLVASRFGQGTPIEREQSSLAREIVRRGHMVGGHTFDHVQLPLFSDAEIEDQLRRSDDAFQGVFGQHPVLFRPPFGAHSQRVDQILAARGYTVVLWNLGAGDFQVRSADEVYDTWQKVFARRERENGDRGGIVLLHDTYAWSIDAFQRIVSDLMARNCDLLDRGEELFDFVDDPTLFYAARAGAPADAEAPPAELAPDLLEQRQVKLRESTARRCKSMASAY